MISLTTKTINIPQGESGTIRVFFKDKKKDFPLILKKIPEELINNGYESRIRFVVREKIDNTTGLEVIKKDYDIDINNDITDASWHRFESSKIIEVDDESGMTEDNILYAVWRTNDMVEFLWEESYVKKEYDYINSSITITFDSEDTKNLKYKKYYYEIAYIEGYNLGKNSENITLKQTWVDTSEFIVSGALV